MTRKPVEFSVLPPRPWLRRAADYGGILSAGLCIIHCAAGPLLLAFVGARGAVFPAGWEWAFLLLSGLMVGLATRQVSSAGLRRALWGFFGLFGATMLLAERWPWLEIVQYGASVGLIGTHLLNQRYCRRCGYSRCEVAAPDKPRQARARGD